MKKLKIKIVKPYPAEYVRKVFRDVAESFSNLADTLNKLKT